MLSYNRANRAVAVLCNHQRAVPKGHDVSMGNLQAKIDTKTAEVEKAEKDYKQAKKSGGAEAEKRKAAVKRLLEQLNRLETQRTDKEENKQVNKYSNSSILSTFKFRCPYANPCGYIVSN